MLRTLLALIVPPEIFTMKRANYIAEIDADELAARMAEAVLRIKRPPGKSAKEALADTPADWGPAFQRGATAAMEYWRECIQKMQQTS